MNNSFKSNFHKLPCNYILADIAAYKFGHKAADNFYFVSTDLDGVAFEKRQAQKGVATLDEWNSLKYQRTKQSKISCAKLITQNSRD